MTQVKYTKIELARYNKKRALFLKYLPTLQLKKMLLQTEVYKARGEIRKAQESFDRQLRVVKTHACLLSDPAAEDLHEHLVIKTIDVEIENIAGIDVPSFRQIVFKQVKPDFMAEPIWFEKMVSLIRSLQSAKQRVKIAEQKRDILENELRTVSIRVNLFEKRLIPETTEIISKIKVFLGDQDLQAVASAKVSKNKILSKVHDEVV